MIFAAAFDYSPLDSKQKKGVVDIVTKELLTPKGLRSLSPKSKKQMKKTIPVIGMACSVCSANVEKKLQSLEGINSASVSLASRTALVDYDPDIISLEEIS